MRVTRLHQPVDAGRPQGEREASPAPAPREEQPQGDVRIASLEEDGARGRQFRSTPGGIRKLWRRGL